MLKIALILATGTALAGALGAAGASGRHDAVLGALNSERAANRIPVRVRENAGWSARCAAHVRYMAATGLMTHEENPRSPQYSSSGNWAARNSVLALSPAGWSRGDPFASAPLHLIQLMSPELREVGVARSRSGYLCVTTWPGYRPLHPAKPTVYTYPGNGAAGVPSAETAKELPFVPGEFVGLPKGTKTGFNLMVYAEGVGSGWNLRIRSASVTGPQGPVELRTVDRTTRGVGDYLPPRSGFLIPVAPLKPHTRYRATVRFAGAPAHTWTFTTGR